MNEKVYQDLNKYIQLPATAEKNEIDRKYNNDEIGSYEFYSLAMEYMRSVEKEAPK